jgi:hypothetical protein
MATLCGRIHRTARRTLAVRSPAFVAAAWVQTFRTSTPHRDRAQLDPLTPLRLIGVLGRTSPAIALRLAPFNEPRCRFAGSLGVNLVRGGAHCSGLATLWKQSLLPEVGRVDSILWPTLPRPHDRQFVDWRYRHARRSPPRRPTAQLRGAQHEDWSARGGRASLPVGRVHRTATAAILRMLAKRSGVWSPSEGARGRPLP